MARQTSTITVVGKLGNAVGFKRSGSKKAGAKFARIRATDIKNPKTNAQLYQRAVAATVTKAYAAMKEICDHSFEGKAVGAESMQYFNSKNMNLLRKAILADVNNQVAPADQVGVVVAPKSAFPTPGPYLVSEGSLTQNFISISEESTLPTFVFPAAASQTETVAEFLAAAGIVAGDIFTLVALGVLNETGAFASQYGVLASQPSTNFGFLRLKVKASALTSTTLSSAAQLSDVFDVEVGGQAVSINAAEISLSQGAITITNFLEVSMGFLGCIRSRVNSKLRSTCYLQTVNALGDSVTKASQNGIKSDYLLNAWINEQDTLGQSALILEGGAI